MDGNLSVAEAMTSSSASSVGPVGAIDSAACQADSARQVQAAVGRAVERLTFASAPARRHPPLHYHHPLHRVLFAGRTRERNGRLVLDGISNGLRFSHGATRRSTHRRLLGHRNNGLNGIGMSRLSHIWLGGWVDAGATATVYPAF